MIPNINLIHLKYFYDAVLLKSISAAARENFVSQSAISQAIIKLEQGLRVNLTTHQRQIFMLTQEGEVVFKKTKLIFEEIEKLKNSLKLLKNEVSGNVVFASTNAIAQFFLAPNYLKIKRNHPLVKLNFERGSLNFIHEILRQKKVSFALAVDTPEFACYDKDILATGNFYLYKAKGLNNNNGIFVDNHETFEVINLRKMYLAAHQKELEIEDSLSGWGMVATFVLNGCGIGFLPEFVFAGNDRVEKVDLGIPAIEYAICAFRPKGSLLSMAAKAIITTLKE